MLNGVHKKKDNLYSSWGAPTCRDIIGNVGSLGTPHQHMFQWEHHRTSWVCQHMGLITRW